MFEPRWRLEGDEPDYRVSLANERTFLAWICTALAIGSPSGPCWSGLIAWSMGSGFSRKEAQKAQESEPGFSFVEARETVVRIERGFDSRHHFEARFESRPQRTAASQRQRRPRERGNRCAGRQGE